MAKEKMQKGEMNMQAVMKIYQKVGTPGAPYKRLASLTESWITKTKSWDDGDDHDPKKMTRGVPGISSM